MDDDTVEESRHLELLRVVTQVLGGSITPEDGVRLLNDKLQSNRLLPSLLLDVLVLIDSELGIGNYQSPSAKTNLQEFCELASNVLIPAEILKTTVESFFDNTVGTRYIKSKTRNFYKQLKFNLFREESEGYAKLITELSQGFDAATFSPQQALSHVRSLIGQFNLDPNRVLDVILECFECNIDQSKEFIQLLKLYKPTSEDISHLLGFKFSFYKDSDKHKAHDAAPKTLFQLAAVLISNSVVDILSVCQYLSPSRDFMGTHSAAMVTAADKSYQKMTSLSAVLDSDIKFGAVDPENREEQLERLQKLSLLLALVEIRDWKYVKFLLDRMPELYAMRFREISLAMCDLIGEKIEPFYKVAAKQFVFMPHRKSKEITVDLESAETVDNIIDSFPRFVNEVVPLLMYVGPTLSNNPIVFTKVIRLCSAYMKQKSSQPSPELDAVFASVVDVCGDVLVPASSLMRYCSAVSEELWGLISQFPYHIRFRFYGKWKVTHMKRHPELIRTKGEVLAKVRYCMKRLSKETTKQTARYLSRLCHTHPTVVFEYIMAQIQQFENLIGPVVESLKFLTGLGYDVMAFCVIEELAAPGREKMKVADVTLSSWLQSMATFVGMAFKKYPIELNGLLQYVANQLKAGKSYDLLVLRELVQSMSGIETSASLTQEQIEALAGGDCLRQEGGYLTQVKNTKSSSRRLKEALLHEDLVVSLCILMAQQRGSIVFKEGVNAHLKLVGQMLDQCQETLVQFGMFVSTNLKTDEYLRRMPTIDRLLGEYNLPIDAAFFLVRPLYQNMIASKFEEVKKTDKTLKSDKLNPSERKRQIYLVASDRISATLADEMKPFLPSAMLEFISPRLMATFWALWMYDLYVPKNSYKREMEKLKKMARENEDSRDISESKRKKERERCAQGEQKLNDEMKKQEDHVDHVVGRLGQEKKSFFINTNGRQAALFFIQHCIYPRAMFTDIDALYCAKFIHLLHNLKTPNFQTILIIDRILMELTPVIASQTATEAEHFGRFLCALLEMVVRWYRDEKAFKEECADSPAFTMKFQVNKVPSPASEWHIFSKLGHKWIHRVTKTMLNCLYSKQYVLLRNCLHILIKILPQFPVTAGSQEILGMYVEKLRDEEKDKRPDLHVLAISYWGQLKAKKMGMPDVFQFDEEKSRIDPSIPISKKKVAPLAAVKRPAPSVATDNTVVKQPVLKEKPGSGEPLKIAVISAATTVAATKKIISVKKPVAPTSEVKEEPVVAVTAASVDVHPTRTVVTKTKAVVNTSSIDEAVDSTVSSFSESLNKVAKIANEANSKQVAVQDSLSRKDSEKKSNNLVVIPIATKASVSGAAPTIVVEKEPPSQNGVQSKEITDGSSSSASKQRSYKEEVAPVVAQLETVAPPVPASSRRVVVKRERGAEAKSENATSPSKSSAKLSSKDSSVPEGSKRGIARDRRDVILPPSPANADKSTGGGSSSASDHAKQAGTSKRQKITAPSDGEQVSGRKSSNKAEPMEEGEIPSPREVKESIHSSTKHRTTSITPADGSMKIEVSTGAASSKRPVNDAVNGSDNHSTGGSSKKSSSSRTDRVTGNDVTELKRRKLEEKHSARGDEKRESLTTTRRNSPRDTSSDKLSVEVGRTPSPRIRQGSSGSKRQSREEKYQSHSDERKKRDKSRSERSTSKDGKRSSHLKNR